MIVFQKVRWRNFLATGDYWNELQLDTGESTLIVGKNGHGKSAGTQAIAFALFGKTLRDIKKNQYVNSTNESGCCVEVEFVIGSNKFRVVRGMKPNVFEIWQNGEKINKDDADARDYQRVLEDTILKLNFKTFHQIVLLGSGSYEPFMELSTGNRREVVEDILDISVFSRMNSVLKKRIEALRDRLASVNADVRVAEEKLKSEKKHLASVKENSEDKQSKMRVRIEELTTKIQDLKKEIADFDSSLGDKKTVAAEKARELIEKQRKGNDLLSSIKTKILALVKEAKFYDGNSTCPTCTQPIAEELKKTRLMECRSQAKTLAEEKDVVEKGLDEIQKCITENGKILDECSEIQTKKFSHLKSIELIQGQISDLNRQIAGFRTSDTQPIEDEIQKLADELDELNRRRNLCFEEGSYNSAAAEMLKDTGIKTKIIRQYLPVMNELVNRYLETLDFFVSFHLNESFEETIKSRHRDQFTYNSFSEGQKKRIDLALLFTWREVARMKNSVSTNLLVLDETFDSSLDAEGTDNLLKILDTLDEGTSVFIISHNRDQLEGKFHRRIEFKLDANGFSRMSTE